jgi:hypothetical protein
MRQDRQQLIQDLLVFALLVALGVAGRWEQPQWCFTPTAAAAIFAGFYFSRWPIALLVPIATLAISDLLLPSYDSVPVLITTYAVMTLPVWLGRMMRREQSRWSALLQWGLFGLLPATLFYLVTNFAVWAFKSNYEKSFAGLMQCYWIAVPFYRWMLAGDMFYLTVLFACWMLAGAPSFSTQRQREA